MFFNNNIFESKRVVINIVKKFVIIKSIDAFIFLKTCFDKFVVYYLVYLRKTTIVSLYTKITVSINNLILSTTKDFLFESNNNLNIFMYVL